VKEGRSAFNGEGSPCWRMESKQPIGNGQRMRGLILCLMTDATLQMDSAVYNVPIPLVEKMIELKFGVESKKILFELNAIFMYLLISKHTPVIEW
jgi:hypothetical protein